VADSEFHALVGKIHEGMKTNLMLIIPEMCMGGAQRSLANLSHELAENANIFLVVFNKQKDVYYGISGTLLSLEVYPGKGWFNKGLALWRRIKKLRALKKELAIDVSISFLEGADYVNILTRGKEKVIISVRGSKIHDEIMKRYHFWFRSRVLIPWIYRKADLIVTVNHGIKNELVEYYGLSDNKIQTINNFYDVDHIRSLSTEKKEEYLDIIYQSPLLITTGRLAPEKRLGYLIRVFIALKKILGDVRLIIAGEGPELAKLLQQCRQANLRVSQGASEGEVPDVIFMGNQQNVFKYLSGSSVYLLNSSSEGFPNGMIEAMICGVPVISTDCPYGPREILAPELNGPPLDKPYMNSTGVLMPLSNTDNDLDHWLQCLSSILENNEYRNKLVQGGLARLSEFNKEKIIAQWLQILGIGK
jgi:glycosyltransferase involved in cell wall biosynthesis